MSSKSNSSDSSPPRVPPHIRLNSGQSNILDKETLGQSRSLIPSPSPSNPYKPGPLGQPPLYSSTQNQESSERLLPPSRATKSRLRDEESPGKSDILSRRSSWGSDRSRDSRGFDNPFRDRSRSRPGSLTGSDDENLNTQTVSEKYNILPSAGLLLFREDVEKDDYLHEPDPKGEPRECDIFTRRGLVNVGGLAMITLGILVLFIGYPVLTFVQRYVETPDPCKGNDLCVKPGFKTPLLKNIRTSLVDPDTPESAKSIVAHDGSTWNLVFSDEFSKPGRSFFQGDDPYFTAVDIWYGVTADLEWYDPDAITTNDGVLEIRMDAYQSHNLNYRSGMLQSWNQLCFKGGRLEASISLPGQGDTVGFWPGFWSMGNLGRPGYASTTDGMWPYTYHDECDAGITPNQSDPNGISWLPGMRLPACTCNGADHPTPGYSRSAPEIDVLEATNGPIDGLGNTVGLVSQSMQLAPMDVWYDPDYNFVEIENFEITAMNVYQGGVYQEAVSGISTLNNAWYNGNAYQTYSYEYTPGAGGDVQWFIGTEKTWRVTGDALGPNGNIGQRVIPTEPMAIIANLGISPGFSKINYTGIATLLPATMRFDYIRIYQDGDGEMTCDPSGYETTTYISEHINAYSNPNFTTWNEAGYERPLNSFMDSC